MPSSPRGASSSAWLARVVTAASAAGSAGVGAATGHPVIGIVSAIALAAGHLIVVGAPTVVSCWIALRAAKAGADPVQLIQELVKLIHSQR